MVTPQLKLPVIQNWSCHNCGGCCREHLIEITAEEKRRIEKQGWTASDGISTDRPVIQKIGHERYRLAHQEDGACVFLDEQGLCRIHAKFGEPAKPLACRVYPYAYHPAGNRLAVSLRFSCPSVVQNLGQPIADQAETLQQLGSQLVADKKTNVAAPFIHRGSQHGPQQTEWSDFHRFLKTLDDAFADDSVDFAVRLMRVLAWLELVNQSQFQTIRGARLEEFLELVSDASVKAQPDNDLPLHRPNRMGRVMFRLLAAQFARHDTEAAVRAGMGHRFGLLNAALKFTAGIGTVPVLHGSASVARAFENQDDGLHLVKQPARFSDLEGEFLCRRPEIDQLFSRYFRVKIQGIHFCGPAYYDTTLTAGFYGLALMYPVVLWWARVRAVRNGRSVVELTDVQAALATIDHNFGYSPALGNASALQRVALLAKMKQITALVGWYSR